MFQAYIRGWRRWAAGLVLVPGLTALGAEALSSRAYSQERSAPASREAEAKELLRQAREAGDAQNYGMAKELAEKARALRELAPSSEEPAEKPVKQTGPKPAVKPTSKDPRVLLGMAKQSLEEGKLDKAHELATQANAHSAGVRWGLFDDTPDSIIKDVKKARGRLAQDQAEKLAGEARVLVEKKASSANDRVANLNAAEEKAKQAASMHGSYSMWDFGDRPSRILADIRKARDIEKLGSKIVQAKAAELIEDENSPPPPRAKTPSNYGARKTPMDLDAPGPDNVRPSELAARKKQAIALMQEGKAFEVGRKYVEAKQKYTEAARLNARYESDEDSPESDLNRLRISVGRKISALVNEAHACIDLKDADGAHSNLDNAERLAKGMGMDTYAIAEVRGLMTPPAPVIRTGTNATAPPATTAVENLPVIRNGSYPPAEPPKIILPARGEEDLIDLIDLIPPAKKSDNSDAIKPISPNRGKPVRPSDVLPSIPDVDTQAEATRPPMPKESPKPSVRVPLPAEAAKGQQMLDTARLELRKGDLETARRIAVELVNGAYNCKDEALALMQSIDTEEDKRKMDSARRAFDNGMEAFHAHSYAQALAIFNQIDGMMLTSTGRKKLGEMIAISAVEKKKMDDARAARTGEKLPTAPKPAPGVPDVPLTGPTPVVKTGPDSMIKQQEALSQVEFQKLRTKSLRVESEATARFGRGETTEALQELSNFVAEVKSSSLETGKQNMLVRPIEARLDRLKILKHQTDFLTKESKDRRDFKSEMTHEALFKQDKQKEVMQLMKASHKLMDDAKYKEAYVQLQKAQALDPDDASVGATLRMADTMMRKLEWERLKKTQEKFNYELGNENFEYPQVTGKEPLRWTDDPEKRKQIFSRGTGNVGVMRTRSDKEKEIERKMSTPLSVSFKGTPLESVVTDLQTMTGINFDLDFNGLKEGNVDPKQPITSNLKDISLKSALNVICAQAGGLKHVIENETIRVTTAKNAAGRQLVKALSVGDLVIPAPNYGAAPHLSLTEQLRMATENAYGTSRMNSSQPRTPPGGLPSGMSTGSGSSTFDPSASGRLRNSSSNAPADGGARSNTGPTIGTLERELIRLVTTTIKPDSWQGLGGEGTIEYFPLGMVMVINQSPEVIEEVERLLESLRKLQDLEVSIEVKVVSLAETFYERIGVDFAMGVPTNAKPIGNSTSGGLNNQNFKGNVLGMAVPGVPTPDLDIPIRATSFGRAVPPFGGFTNSFQDGGISLGLAFLSDIQVQMFLEAAQGDTRTNVMQAPKLTALNGTSASMTVGDFQFFVTGVQVTSVNGQLVFTPQNVPFAVGITQPIPPNASVQNGSLNFTPTTPQTPGLGLFIQPVVSADRRFVRLNIQQSFTNLVSGTQQIPITTIITPVFENGGQGQPVPFTQFLQQPRFSNLETQTVVVVPDGGTVVMGGLKYMTEGRNEFGPPVLSKIPYLNRLFKNVAYGREGRSILIMVTPRVIINREEQERQTGVRDDDGVGAP